ncbi:MULTISPECIES: response regulator transcription factor [unclassified Granulicatella]|uniref:response regulator transcription factor n=1 Tax=unclassified Granulicatella TaxID=2630493 RepID=UPI0010731C4C|nr:MULTISPECIES: response regulator transcription factor [unclassified Granulicatella]MBF0779728.1 response regulator transcription factor [Granulicatella sp. 19428wC4_WM01]TFU96248.1 response regulator transcription factor [Granulicatella sp. WM01]
MYKILVVEDDQITSQVICEFLKEHQYEYTAVFDGQAALDCYKEGYDLILLDIMLPKVSGLDVLKEIRQSSQIPVIVITALDDEYTQLISFNHLVNDYVTKPFSPLILMKRIENVLRQIQTPKTLTVGNLHILLDSCMVYWQGEEVNVTKREYEIIEFLSKRKNRLVPREQLMEYVWGYGEFESRVLDNHIKNIRKKIQGIPLETFKGKGYRLNEM